MENRIREIIIGNGYYKFERMHWHGTADHGGPAWGYTHEYSYSASMFNNYLDLCDQQVKRFKEIESIADITEVFNIFQEFCVDEAYRLWLLRIESEARDPQRIVVAIPKNTVSLSIEKNNLCTWNIPVIGLSPYIAIHRNLNNKNGPEFQEIYALNYLIARLENPYTPLHRVIDQKPKALGDIHLLPQYIVDQINDNDWFPFVTFDSGNIDCNANYSLFILRRMKEKDYLYQLRYYWNYIAPVRQDNYPYILKIEPGKVNGNYQLTKREEKLLVNISSYKYN